MTSGMNMNGSIVTLDLVQINGVLDSAVTVLHDRLQDQLRTANEEIRSAAIAQHKGDEHGHYLGLCHANTQREYFVRTAQQLSEAIHAKFHVAEAIKRGEVVCRFSQTPA